MVREKIKYSNFSFFKDLWGFIGKYKFKFTLFSFILILSFLLELVPAIILSKIIDFFTLYSLGSSLKYFYVLLLILIGVSVLGHIFRISSKYALTNLLNTIDRNSKVASFQKLVEADLSWHEKENTGNKIEKISVGVDSIRRFMDFYMNTWLKSIVSIIGVIIVFTYFNPKYFIFALVYAVIHITIEIGFMKRLSLKTIEFKLAKEKSAGKVYEFSSNISTVKSLGIEKASNKEVGMREEDIFKIRKSLQIIRYPKIFLLNILATIFFATYLFAVGKDVIAGVLTVGTIVIYIDYVRRIQNSLFDISGTFEVFIDIKYSLYRLVDLYNSILPLDESNAINLERWSEIKLEDVSFKYKNEEVLDNFNLTINKGEKIGVVGKSGSGKSTLFKLLLKLYLPQKGQIYFNSLSINNLKRDSIINKFSIVPQETELFNMSFKDNILVSSYEEFNIKKYKKALEISQCLPILDKLKEKDDTLIGEKGVRLSGGEKQRLGIARAIYRDSDIIIFDESTSNLDYETERIIQKSFDTALADKTLIFSAHRLSTLRNMDRILVIDKGKIIEQGNYEELVKRKEEFYNLLMKQERKK
jgi:ABC-type multidrug transport system fused ATPase/permease subunit